LRRDAIVLAALIAGCGLAVLLLHTVGQQGQDTFVTIMLGNGDGTFQPAVSFATGADPVALAASDCYGDGNST